MSYSASVIIRVHPWFSIPFFSAEALSPQYHVEPARRRTGFCLLPRKPPIAPRIEGYTQRAAVEFYQSLRHRNCYVNALNYHSYAQYFYSGTEQQQPPPAELLNGPLDREVYFVCKNYGDDPLVNYPHLEYLGEKNGYLFYRRSPGEK